jgi:hypothetical protein
MKQLMTAVICGLFIICAHTAFAGNYSSAHEHGSDVEAGIGLDVVVHEGKDGEIVNKVTLENKFDWNNGEQSHYAVVTTKLADVVDKVKSLFNKE